MADAKNDNSSNNNSTYPEKHVIETLLDEEKNESRFSKTTKECYDS